MKSKNSRRGLLAGGNWIIDQVKLIDVYPQPEQLGNIRGQSQGTGGAPYNVLVDLAAAGSAIVVISQDLDELRALCDTLAVINMGHLSEARPTADVSVEEIGLLMGGVHGTAEARDAIPA